MTQLDQIVRKAAGDELRRLRLQAGLSQRELANRVGSHRPIIGRIEHGRHTTSVRVAAEFAYACGGGLGHVLLAIDKALGLVARQEGGA